ncbi:hypothetical protein BXU08_12460 [Sphingomonas sp. LM7]|nr:hypothetical protein BXU08_12460 [Sphingomonas sp. LM7]
MVANDQSPTLRDPRDRHYTFASASVIMPIEIGIAFRGTYRAVLDQTHSIAMCTDPDLVESRKRLDARMKAVIRDLRTSGFGHEMDVVDKEYSNWLAQVSLMGCDFERERNLASARRWDGALDRLQQWLPAASKES